MNQSRGVDHLSAQPGVATSRRVRGPLTALVTAATVMSSLALATTVAPPASAAGGCDKYASPTGNDASSGATPAQAVASPIVLLSRLSAGQTGCLQDGATFVLGGGEAITAASGTAGSPKTLRPTTPGARATITTATGFWIQAAAHDLALQDLDIRRHGTGGGSLMLIDGDRISLSGMDLTYANNICLDVGEDSRNGSTNPAEDFSLTKSRVHDCGSSYGPPHFQNDSGVHGIYLQFIRDGADSDSVGALIEDDYIYRNNNRGIQLYPDVHDALIRRNVLYGNGANLNLGSQADAGVYSRDNTITDNVIAQSRLDGLAPGGFVGDLAEVLGNYPANTQVNNHVDGNCISNTTHPDALYAGYASAFTHVGNIENQPPVFVDAAQGNFAQTPASPCRAMGPDPIAPPPVDDVPTLSIGDTVTVEGNGHVVTQMQFAVTRSGPTTGVSTVQVGQAPGTATSPDDYTLTTSSITFAAGATTAYAVVSLVSDDVVEPDETFTLRLSGATGATIARAVAGGAIVNDDSAQPSPLESYGVDEQVRRLPGGTFVGVGTGANVTLRIQRGTTARYHLRVLNTGRVTDSFAMVGTRSQTGVRVAYRDGDVDRTAAFLGGNATTGSLAVNASHYYTVRLTVAANAVRGSERFFYLDAVSYGASRTGQHVRDRIRLRVVVS